jgi:hypothetical protein
LKTDLFCVTILVFVVLFIFLSDQTLSVARLTAATRPVAPHPTHHRKKEKKKKRQKKMKRIFD